MGSVDMIWYVEWGGTETETETEMEVEMEVMW